MVEKKTSRKGMDADLDHYRQLDGDPFALTAEERAGFRLSEKLHKEQMGPVEAFQPMDTETLLQVSIMNLFFIVSY